MAARARRPARESDLLSRVLIAIPAVLFAILIVGQGGLVFALGIFALGVLAMGELYTLMGRVRPVNLGGFLTLGGMIAAALYGEPRHVIMALAVSFPLVFWLSFFRPRREHVSWALAATFFGVLWVGIPMVHAVFLREAPHGDGLVVDVLIGHLPRGHGRLLRRALLRPPAAGAADLARTRRWRGCRRRSWAARSRSGSPASTRTGSAGADALLIGLAVALAAPVGDLFESLVKRDLAVKDTGTFFGAHGGVLDRLDAVFFTMVAGYYAAQALGYA